ncbi:MAG TPA: AAA family ATPase [Chroococcales cyanobacterium]
MALTDFYVRGYRSVKDVWLRLKPINVIVGANGTGKSNLYRALNLISSAAAGRLAAAFAEEGGLPSALWAGRFKKFDKKNTIRLSVRVGKYEYNLECGYAGEFLRPDFFLDDPVVTREEIFLLEKGHRHKLLHRKGKIIVARNAAGKEVEYLVQIPDSESVFLELSDPANFPHLFSLRQEFLNWRFYHHFRTDEDSPIRKPQIGFLTPVLNNEGTDLASALASIKESGDAEALARAVDEAFPGSGLIISRESAGLKILMDSPDFPGRPFTAAEFSDGTLQYLCLVAALLSLKAAPFVAFNEPETSLHPRLIEPLARLIVEGSRHSQVWITTHSRDLADAIMDKSGYEPLELAKEEGETTLVGVGLGGYKEKEDWFDDD